MLVKCSECVYFDRAKAGPYGNTSYGKCRREPPKILEYLQREAGVWPTVEDRDSCGAGAKKQEVEDA